MQFKKPEGSDIEKRTLRIFPTNLKYLIANQARSHGAFGGNDPQFFDPQLLCPEKFVLKTFNKNKNLSP